MDKNKVKEKDECFVIMPISDPDGYSKGHFDRVYNDIFIPAINKAGFKPVRADDEKATNLIHIEILRKIIDSPMALCDLSTRNPNVLFELGIRQAFDKPVVLVQEINTPRIFDISSIRSVDYRSKRIYNEVLEDQEIITEAVLKTKEAFTKGSSVNSIIRLLSITNPASIDDIKEMEQDPSLKYILAELSDIRSEIRKTSIYNKELNKNSFIQVEIENGHRKFYMIREFVEECIGNKEIHSKVLKDIKDLIDTYRHLAAKTDNVEFYELVDKFTDLRDYVQIKFNDIRKSQLNENKKAN